MPPRLRDDYFREQFLSLQRRATSGLVREVITNFVGARRMDGKNLSQAFNFPNQCLYKDQEEEVFGKSGVVCRNAEVGPRRANWIFLTVRVYSLAYTPASADQKTVIGS